MNTEIASQKQIIRAEVQRRISALSIQDRKIYDSKIIEHTLTIPPIEKADGILGYMPMKDEINIIPLLEKFKNMGKSIFLPRVISKNGNMEIVKISSLDKDLKVGAFGILEPKNSLPQAFSYDIPLVLIPGRAFTLKGERLGRGKGFYDRFLEKSENTLKISLCYSCQIFEALPTDHNDIPVDIVISEDGL